MENQWIETGHAGGRRPRRGWKRGFVLIGTAVSVIVLLGALGLAVDLGRAYIAKNEAQAFTDAAALSAAFKLNNTLAGIAAAKAEVTASTNKWDFATKPLDSVKTEFSTNKTTWTENPATGTGYKFVRVTAGISTLAVTFSRAISSREWIPVGAQTVAGVEPPTTYPQGVFPFAPIAKSLTAPHFGYVKGDELTLLWPSSVGSNGPVKMNNLCAADRNQASLDAVQAGTTADRGYIQEPDADSIREAIEDDQMDYVVTLGLSVMRTGGVKTTDVYQSLNARSDQDSLRNETNYDQYNANHDASLRRRVVVVPIIGDAVNAVVLGFVKVFLPPNQAHPPNQAKCAQYIGPVDTPTGNDGSGANIVRILQ